MDNSIYVALSRQTNQFRNMEVTANNIANANTLGYNMERMMFTKYLVNEGSRQKLAFSQDIATYRITKDGPLKHTDNPLDMAINGPGYFVIETALGERYTKAGNFTKGADGTIMTLDGYPVLDNNGQRIVIEETDKDIKIGELGDITVTTPAGEIEERGTLGMVEFDDEQRMERLSSQLYKTEEQPLEALNSRMMQGVLETSNVNAIEELVKTTKLSRAANNTAKFIEVIYDLQRKTSNVYAQSQ